MLPKKRITIIIGSLLFLAVLSAVVLLYFYDVSRDKKKAEDVSKQEIPVLPLPQGDKYLNIDIGSTSNEGIEQALDKFKATNLQERAEEKYIQIRIHDDKKKLIPLEEFARVSGINIYTKIEELLNNEDYYLVKCALENGEEGFGLVINVKLFDSYPDLYKNELARMKDWEKTMFQDVHEVIFPKTNFSEALLSQKVSFKDGKYRYAEIVMPDSSKGSINYNIVFDSIIISNSFECLERVSLDCETIEP